MHITREKESGEDKTTNSRVSNNDQPFRKDQKIATIYVKFGLYPESPGEAGLLCCDCHVPGESIVKSHVIIKAITRIFEKGALDQGYRIRWEPRIFMEASESELSFDLEFVIAHLMLSRPSIFFIQIGANDGISNDPLHKFITQFCWKGILLEPLPEVFTRLTTTYRNDTNLQLISE